MIETKIYGQGKNARVVVVSHGASESMIISDTDWPEEHDGWGNPIEKEKEEKFKWFNPDPIEK